ncbi:MAG: amidohydrolase [Thermoanaerobaculia bacterium]|nr:amidohydrolase [Thermoanaerobaculia bacterium]
MRRTTAILLLFAGLGIAGAVRGQEPADRLLRGGRFYTAASPAAIEGDLAIRGGRIVSLGPAGGAAELVGPDTEIVELEGRTVTPGFIDAHSHLSSLGAALAQVDLVGTVSYEEVVERVRERPAATAPGEWVRGRGWDQNDWSVQQFPVHGPLSEAVPDHPVWLTRIDGHAALLNRRAMDLLGLDATAPDPPGGRVLRSDTGEPTGVLIDTAMAVGGAIPDPSAEELQRRIVTAAEHCLARGLTTVTEMGLDALEIDAYRALRRAGRLPLRTAIFLDDDPELLEQWFARGPAAQDRDARLIIRGIKLYADGALGSRGAALVEPYSDDPGNLGLLITGGDRIESVCRRALETGFQVGTHAIGDRGALVVLDAYERCFDGRPRPEARFRVEHAQVLRPADIERMGRLGVIASVQPTHATSDMPWAGDRVGPRRIEGAYAWQRLSAAGALLALGSDFPVESADPRLGFYAAVTRQDLSGRPEGGWQPDQRLSRAEALAGFTRDAARSLFLENEVGTLEVGRRADLVVFARDIMTVPAAEIPEVAVDLTLVDGEIVFRRVQP